jgi:hypothetical protein
LQPHRQRKWDYKTFGGFSFEKNAYCAEVKKLLLPYSVNGTLTPRSSGKLFTVEGESCKDENADWISIRHAIWAIKPTKESYAILTPSEPIQNSVYLQAALPIEGYDDGLGYIVETRLADGESFKHYQIRIKDCYEVLKIFKAYYDYQSLQDISFWNDITEQFINKK